MMTKEALRAEIFSVKSKIRDALLECESEMMTLPLYKKMLALWREMEHKDYK